MSEPVIIIVTAETAAAAADLKKLGAAGCESLNQIRNTSILARQGFQSLSNTIYLLGGARFPVLGQSLMAGRAGLMALRTTAMLTGSSVAALVPVLGGVAAAAGLGALAWRSYNSVQLEADKKAKELAESLREIPGLLERIQSLTRSGLISPAAAAQFADYLSGKTKLYRNTEGGVTREAFSTVEAEPVYSSFGARLNPGAMARKPNRPLEPKEINEWVSQQPAFQYEAQAVAKNKFTEVAREASLAKLEGIEKEKAVLVARYEAKFNQIQLLQQQEGLLATSGEFRKAQQAKLDLAAALTRELAAIDQKAADEEVRCNQDALDRIEAAQKAQAAAEKQRRQEEMAGFDKDRAKKQAALDAIRNDPYTSIYDQAAAEAKAIELALAANEARIAYLQSAAKQTADAAAALEAQKQITELMREQDELQNQLAQTLTRGSFWDSYMRNLKAVKDQWQDLSTSLVNGSFLVLQQGMSGLSGALTSIIMGTQSAAQAFAQFGASLLSSFISMIINCILWALVGIPILAALSTLMGGAPAAAGSVATTAAVSAGVSGAMSAATSGMAMGGLVRGPGTSTSDSIPAFLSDGEFVVRADAVDRIGLSHLEAMNSGVSRVSAVEPEKANKIDVLFFMDRQELLNHLKSSDAQKIILACVAANRRKLGIVENI